MLVSNSFMSDLIIKIDHFIKDHDLLPKDGSVVLGLSGGPDSVFLLHLLAEYKKKGVIKNLIAAHFDHEWRKDSHKDAQFCKKLAAALDVQFVSSKASDLTSKFKKTGSKEELGRIMRRYFFETVRNEYDADVIALAHHLQDQEETFFIRLIRGTTLTGLVGMRPKDGVYVRPLLETNKSDIVAYLNTHKIDYLVDPTNIEELYLRNRIRKHVLPALEQCDQRFHANFLRTHQHLEMAEQFISIAIEQVFASIAAKVDHGYEINLKKFRSLDRFVQNRLLVYWFIKEQIPFALTESYLDEIMRFIMQPAGSKQHKLHQQWSLVKAIRQMSIKKSD